MKLTNFAPTPAVLGGEEAVFGNVTVKFPTELLRGEICERGEVVWVFSDCRHRSIMGLSGSIMSSRMDDMMEDFLFLHRKMVGRFVGVRTI